MFLVAIDSRAPHFALHFDTDNMSTRRSNNPFNVNPRIPHGGTATQIFHETRRALCSDYAQPDASSAHLCLSALKYDATTGTKKSQSCTTVERPLCINSTEKKDGHLVAVNTSPGTN